MSFTDTDRSLFNVVVVSNVPCAGEPYRHSEVANVQPLEWSRAVKWLQGILEGVGRYWLDEKFTDAYIEPADCPRPWSPDTLAAFNRVCGYTETPGREGVHVELFQQAADRLMGRVS